MAYRESKIKNEATFAVTLPKTVQTRCDKSTCRYCGRHGHEELGCFELVGYLTDWVSRGGGCGHARGHGGRVGRGGSNRGWANLAIHATPGQTRDQ